MPICDTDNKKYVDQISIELYCSNLIACCKIQIRGFCESSVRFALKWKAVWVRRGLRQEGRPVLYWPIRRHSATRSLPTAHADDYLPYFSKTLQDHTAYYVHLIISTLLPAYGECYEVIWVKIYNNCQLLFRS